LKTIPAGWGGTFGVCDIQRLRLPLLFVDPSESRFS